MTDFEAAAEQGPPTTWGPFFDVDPVDLGAAPHPCRSGAGNPGRVASGGQTWRLLGADLASPDVMGVWIARARERTATTHGVHPADVDARALGAVLHLGVCARALSPWIGAALKQASVGRPAGAGVPTLDDLWWQDDGTTTFPLAIAHASSADRPRAVDDTSTADDTGLAAFAHALVERLAIPLTATALTSSDPTAWGNVASALHGAARTVAWADPGQATAVRAIADACLAALTTAHNGRPLADGRIGTATFRRHSCCQLHRLPGNSRDMVCGDCVLRERTGAPHG